MCAFGNGSVAERYGDAMFGVLNDLLEALVPLNENQYVGSSNSMQRPTHINSQVPHKKFPQPLPRHSDPILRNVLKQPLATPKIKQREPPTFSLQSALGVNICLQQSILQDLRQQREQSVFSPVNRKTPSWTAEVGIWITLVDTEGDIAGFQGLGKQDASHARADDEDVSLFLH